MLIIEYSAFFLAAALLLILPLNWLLAAFVAAICHELSHIAVLYLLGGRVLSIQIGARGIVLETDSLTYGKELLCAAAGPLMSFLLFLVRRQWPVLAICAGVHALFNLLPVYPLDGGRMLHCALHMILPDIWADRIARLLQWLSLSGIVIAAVLVCLFCKLGMLPALTALMLSAKAVFRKIPCKQRRIGVQ